MRLGPSQCSMAYNAACTDADPALPPELLLRVLSFLPPNALALTGRLICKDAAQHFSQRHHITAFLSQPLPHREPSRTCSLALDKARQGVTALSFRRQLHLFSTAVASGSEANLDLVWAVVQPRVFPELLHSGPVERVARRGCPADPGVAAAKAGHPHLLPWLLAHCPGLLDPVATLVAFAQHCSLAVLQRVWEEWLGARVGRTLAEAEARQPPGAEAGVDGPLKVGGWGRFWQQLLDAAAVCTLPEGGGKVEWVLQVGAGHCHVRPDTVSAAVRSGDLARVRWLVESHRGKQQQQQLWEQGACPVLAAALQHADLSVVEALVRDGSCSLPDPGDTKACKSLVWHAAASGSVFKLQWLDEARGLLVVGEGAADAAARSGHLDALRYLWDQASGAVAEGGARVLDAAVREGHVDIAAWLLQQGCTAKWFTIHLAVEKGDLRMLKFLVGNARVPRDDYLFMLLPDTWPDTSSALDAELCAAARVLLNCSSRSSSSRVEHDLFWVDSAAGRGHMPLIRTMLSSRPGFTTLPAMFQFLQHQAVQGGCQDVLQWLEGLRAGGGGGGAAADASVLGTWQWSGLKDALLRGDLATATFLVGHGAELPPDAVTQAAAEGCALSAVQWLAGQWAVAGAVKVAEVRRAMGVAKDRDVREWLAALLLKEEVEGK